ncbi:hypothetical protein K491DRAFT_183581 [Lophiostoma macrostomum CBS 122681]|uniref:Uncharacterized protein n=1 Tax=Lophiostoma macrostomum CBS 122681 TaxID=1314788 RepID=A0A6A6TS13_9PLEO|nr:hypothetical protein K491DRAFT_183581 [Lophiostoma macrostomum CBS 122681]
MDPDWNKAAPNTTASQQLDSENVIWSTQWTPNHTVDRKFFDGIAGDYLDQMLHDGLHFNGVDDSYVPFALCAAQNKYANWSYGLELPDPRDPDYAMLTYAHKVSTGLLDRFKSTAQAMECFTDRYVEEIRRGDLEYLQEAKIFALEQFIPDAPSGIAGKRVFDTCSELCALYDTVRPSMLPLRPREKSAELLEKWKETLSEWRFGLQLTSTPSFHEGNTHYATSIFWKTAFRCTERIEAAHNAACVNLPTAVSIPAFLELETLI